MKLLQDSVYPKIIQICSFLTELVKEATSDITLSKQGVLEIASGNDTGTIREVMPMDGTEHIQHAESYPRRRRSLALHSRWRAWSAADYDAEVCRVFTTLSPHSTAPTPTSSLTIVARMSLLGHPSPLQRVINAAASVVTFIWQFSFWFENVSFPVILAYTAHYRLCDYALYKSTIDTDIDIGCRGMRALRLDDVRPLSDGVLFCCRRTVARTGECSRLHNCA